MTELRPDFARALERFSSERWRERKQAARELLAAVKQVPPAPDELALLVERLLDGLVTPDSVAMRSVCHEVLVGIGPSSVPSIRRRLRAVGPGARMIVDLIADVGAADDVPLLAGILAAPGDDNVRAAAAAALGALGGAEAARALTEALADGSEMLRLFALDALARLGVALPQERLAPLLADPVTRRAAAGLLGFSADPTVAVELVRLLADPMAGVRAAAAVGLVRLHAVLAVGGGGRPLAVAEALAAADGEPLRRQIRELLAHRNLEVRLAALALAGALADAGALPHVLGVMSDPELRERAVEFAGGLGETALPVFLDMLDRTPPEAQGDLFVLVSALGPVGGHERLYERLTAALADAHAACMAATALGRIGGPPVLPALAQALALEGPAGEAAAVGFASVAARTLGRRLAAVAPYLPAWTGAQGALARNLCRVYGLLGRGGDLGFVAPLVARLGDHDPGLRLLAARALGQIPGEHEGVAALATALRDDDPAVRAAVCRSLGQLGAAASVPALLSASRDPSALVRATAVQALVHLGDPQALPRLREVVQVDASPAVVIQAIDGLSRSDADLDLVLLMTLTRAHDHEVVKAAARGLSRCASHRATAAVIGLLDHARWDVRWAAAEALAERGDPTALAPMRRLQAVEPDPLVRQVLSAAVSRLELPRPGEGDAS